MDTQYSSGPANAADLQQPYQQQQYQPPWDHQQPIDSRPPPTARVSSTAVPGHPPDAVLAATRPLEPASAISTPFEGTSLKSIRLATELSIHELINVRNHFPVSSTTNAHKVRAYHDIALSDLYLLRKETSALAKAAEARRTRKWVFGVLIASFIPAVRKIFRRSADDKEANDTEYAFHKSRSLLDRITDSVTPGSRTGFLAQMTLFVCAVLYVFQNEVTIRVAKTMSKRLKKLASKIEGGIEVLDEQDLKVLKGWRWRILLWQ